MAKLVRDRIPEIIRSKGEDPRFYVASYAQYGRALLSKLEEEVHEFLTKPSVEELADISEVIRAINEHYRWDVERERVRKERERGGFEKRYILE
jgi:predicted house-cleaning noncanonical NTP pyrophosphatase (MazG superfamily)